MGRYVDDDELEGQPLDLEAPELGDDDAPPIDDDELEVGTGRRLVDFDRALEAKRAAAELEGRRDRSWLDVLEVDELAKRAQATPPRYLVDGLWPADAYGVIGAEDKAGKTWAMLDLAVSVASGTPWLGLYGVERGRVLLMLGEGGERGLHRKLEAVCRSRGLELDDLRGQVRVSTRVPHLTKPAHLAEVAAELEAHPVALSILDPLYLAAAGAKGADLYAMGALLGELQRATEPGALAVSTHWSKTGKSVGADRFSGVGPGAWGRVLGSAEKKRASTDAEGASVVELVWRFTGGEIADAGFAIRRRVWADDVHDLASPLHYAVELTEGDVPVDTGPKLAPSAERILRAIGPDRLTVRDIGDRLAQAGKPLKVRTIQEQLVKLAELGYADTHRDELPGMPALWWRK